MKRKDYLDWDTTFMGIAQLISFRSKDPDTRHGAIIVNSRNKIISLGYNGFPDGCSDDEFPWTKPDKYYYVRHAERNAIDNALTSNLEGCKLYLWSEKKYLPCSQCAGDIAQKKISEVILTGSINTNTEEYDWGPSLKILEAANVKVRILEQPKNDIDKIIAQFNHIKGLI